MPYTLTLNPDEFAALVATLEDARNHYTQQAKDARDHPDVTIPGNWTARASRAGILLDMVSKLRSA